ncbi:GNAT family N-acetyltransferase [Streptomyces beihaiensis]|uniref:GNAT family N-acetyltransferase n=1 Tax=Streptomyces beihaiensis TaxID=2984495 RepID=A0ABT3TP73_9ACTN|nr:GNAT family N-acetyltransferase [Streptomyces beihaiensis]MCX3058802.1 GNAT family N-acetyltransferase [Streptomyces beihaiensis]
MSGGPRIRGVAEGDWAVIGDLESQAYAPLGLSEGPGALRKYQQASPDTCFVVDVGGGRVAGYLMALPFPEGGWPELGQGGGAAGRRGGRAPYGPLAPDPYNLHLHDVVIAPELRRRGLAMRLVRHLVGIARTRAYRSVSLVSVGGTQAFWRERGFTVRPDVAAPGGYGSDAVYMSLSLADAPIDVPIDVPTDAPIGELTDELTDELSGVRVCSP